MKNRNKFVHKSTVSKTNVHFDISFVPCVKANVGPIHAEVRAKPKLNSGGVLRALVKEKKKVSSINKICDRYELQSSRTTLPLNIVSVPKDMTNLGPKIQTELVSDSEAKEIAYHLSCNNKSYKKCKMNLPNFKNEDCGEIDPTSVTYLHNTYSQLHEREFEKLNELLSENKDRELTLKRKQKNLQRDVGNHMSLDVEEDDEYKSENSFSSENSCENNEITDITKDLGVMNLDKNKLKPIITFTPVHSGEEVVYDYRISPISDRPSSGSSSPLLEVPAADFENIAAERMRPPIN